MSLEHDKKMKDLALEYENRQNDFDRNLEGLTNARRESAEANQRLSQTENHLAALRADLWKLIGPAVPTLYITLPDLNGKRRMMVVTATAIKIETIVT